MTSIEKLSDEELVRLLAEQGMGYEVVPSPTGHASLYRSRGGDEEYFLWNPLTDPNDRDMLIEAMNKKGWLVELFAHPDGTYRGQYLMGMSKMFAYLDADTPGRAVCLAAAKALAAAK